MVVLSGDWYYVESCFGYSWFVLLFFSHTFFCFFFFFQAEDGIRDKLVTGVQTCALPIWRHGGARQRDRRPELRRRRHAHRRAALRPGAQRGQLRPAVHLRFAQPTPEGGGLHRRPRLQDRRGEAHHRHGRPVRAAESLTMFASLSVALLALLQQPVPAPMPVADTNPGRPCEVAIDTLPRVRQVTAGAAANYFGGGGVVAHCKGTNTRLKSDSVAYFSGAGRFDMIGNVHIRDSSLALDANVASYFLNNERLEAHNHVVAVNRNNRSVLRGPNLTYYRAVTGVRDTLELFASSRPTIEYRGTADSSEPYLIVADRVPFKARDRMSGGR